MSNIVDPRILFAAERTLLAWNRTSIALMAFGFLIERSGLLLLFLMPEKTSSLSTISTLWIGLGFIFLSVMCAISSAKQYVGVLAVLNQSDIPKGYNSRWGIYINVLVAMMGLLLVCSLVLGH